MIGSHPYNRLPLYLKCGSFYLLKLPAKLQPQQAAVHMCASYLALYYFSVCPCRMASNIERRPIFGQSLGELIASTREVPVVAQVQYIFVLTQVSTYLFRVLPMTSGSRRQLLVGCQRTHFFRSLQIIIISEYIAIITQVIIQHPPCVDQFIERWSQARKFGSALQSRSFRGLSSREESII